MYLPVSVFRKFLFNQEAPLGLTPGDGAIRGTGNIVQSYELSKVELFTIGPITGIHRLWYCSVDVSVIDARVCSKQGSRVKEGREAD